MRTLYLTRSLSINGRGSFQGRALYDALDRASEAILLGHYVVDASDDVVLAPALEPDAVQQSVFRAFDPTLIYLEGGLGGGGGTWRVPRSLLEEQVRRGATLIVADVDAGVVAEEKQLYGDARQFLRAGVDFGREDSRSSPVYAVDLQSNWRSDRTLVLRPENMNVSDWLKPVYDGVEEVIIGYPAVLSFFESLLATGNKGTSGTLQSDVWVERIHAAPLASVRALGLGYVVFIAGSVSPDIWLERAPGNVRWLVNCALFLTKESDSEARRRSPLRELQDALTAARAVATALGGGDHAGDEANVTLRPALENAAAQATKSEPALAAENELKRIFSPALWARLPPSARRFLITADVLRRNVEDYRSNDPVSDFSLSVVSYSKAVEVAMSELLFEPYRHAVDFHTLPRDGSKQQRTSLDALRRYFSGGHLGLGQMARCLENVVCGMGDVPENGFRAFLGVHGVDVEALCNEARFPPRLRQYVDTYRNRAVHVSTMTLDECLQARQYLLEEPAMLLVRLASLVPDQGAGT